MTLFQVSVQWNIVGLTDNFGGVWMTADGCEAPYLPWNPGKSCFFHTIEKVIFLHSYFAVIGFPTIKSCLCSSSHILFSIPQCPGIPIKWTKT